MLSYSFYKAEVQRNITEKRYFVQKVRAEFRFIEQTGKEPTLVMPQMMSVREVQVELFPFF